MLKGFSDNEVKDNTQNTQLKETKKEKKGLNLFLKVRNLLTLCQVKNK